MKRLRKVLALAVTESPERGGALVERLVHVIRGAGGFLSGSDQYAGEDLVHAAERAFAEVGFELDPEGHLRPLLLEGLEGRALTDALWTYVRRARSGATDDALVVGTAKDLTEAIARHVLLEVYGDYPAQIGVPGTLFRAFDCLGMQAPQPAVLASLDSDARIALRQAAYLFACAANKLRNSEGSGHGRPQSSTADAVDGRLCAQAAAAVGDLLLSELSRLRP